MSNRVDACIVGGGAFGTTLASILAARGRRVLMWVHRAELAQEINQRHTNAKRLPEHQLAPSIEATTDIALASRSSRIVLMTVPSTVFRGVARSFGEHLSGEQIVVHATKGIEIESFLRMTQVLRQETCALKIGVLSGPTLALELAAGRPAGCVVASRFDEVVGAVQELFTGTHLRVHRGRDVVGVELGGAFANIVAIAAGAADGLGIGYNAKGLLVSRGLLELSRLGTSLGAELATFGGLAGVGDLMATCTSGASRNYHLGRLLSEGAMREGALARIAGMVEGVPTTEAVYQQARRAGMKLAVVSAVHGLLFENRAPSEVLAELLGLPAGDELAACRVSAS